MEYQRRKPTTFWFSWDSNPNLQQKISVYQLSKEKALQIQDLMGFKPMTKYFPASDISKKKAYETLKKKACGISREKAYNTLAFMGFKPIISNKNSISSNIEKTLYKFRL